MRNKLAFATLATVFYVVVLALNSNASHPGCCCTPVTLEGYLVSDHEACDPSFNFTANLPNATHPTCNDVCNATLAAPITVGPPPADCSSPAYKPAPSSLAVIPIKGQKHLKLSFFLPCPANSVNISRCIGDDCTNFAHVAQIAPTSVFIDVDSALYWNTTYLYKVVATYTVSGPSQPAIATGNPGDIECWNQGSTQFCLSSFYYELFEKYLKSRGYASTTAQSFANNFPAAVNATFSSKFNKAWTCNEINRLFRTPSMADCGTTGLCVNDEGTAVCVMPGPCGTGGIFGLYFTQETCEGAPAAPKYCFYDRSRGSVDSCFACNPRMSCADYRSRGACTRDQCKAGVCEWHDVFSGMGIGACVDTRLSNCVWCTKPGTLGMENNESYNEVFDRCNGQKSVALAVPGHPCVYNVNTQQSLGCDAAACMDYSATGCGAPSPGITLNPDNSLATTSTDVCNIKVCQVMGTLGCVKNHDGNAASDCAVTVSDRRACELDYFAPNTSFVVLSSMPSRMDWLKVQLLDKVNATHEGAFMQGKPGYKLHVCVVSPSTPCTDATAFVSTNLSALNFNDLSLQAGKTALASMVSGTNTLRYYGVDNRNNPEVVKEMTITACSACQGPKVLELIITPGKYVVDKYYTISDLPVITVSFNEPATITSATLSSGTTAIPLAASPASGAYYDYTFVPMSPLPDGTYLFTFNAKDSNGLLMDAPGSATIVVDTTPGTVTILPPDGTVINDTSVTITLIFAEPLSIIDATLESEVWVSKYATKKIPIDLKPLLRTNDNATYTATVTGLTGGKKNIIVHAEDFAGNPTIGKSSFWVNQGPLQVRMREPSWGVAGAYVFDIVIDTTRIAQCKYVYNTPTAPPATQFEIFPIFTQTTGVTHTLPGFAQIPPGDVSKHPFHAYCKMGSSIVSESFNLSVDPTPPRILTAFAQPSTIIERRVPGMNVFTTTLKVQTDDEGFCKYSTQNVPFVLMTGLFSGFDEMPKKAHTAELNVTEENKTYTYYVACKNTAEKFSPTVPVTFKVDLSVPFGIMSLTPPYSNSTTLAVRIEANKRAFCYVGTTPDTILTCMGACEYGYAYVHQVTVNASGNHTWHVRCSTGAGNEVAQVAVPVVVDTTPPIMLYVNDSSNLPEEPEFSYFLDRLQVRFLGTDAETSVNAYYYRILSFFGNTTVLNWTLSTNTNGTAFYVIGLNLTNGNKYKFEVYPANIVGLRGAAMASDGVTIDIEKLPETCGNGIADAGETDLDCGGQCPGCLDGAKCSANVDCASGFCNNGVCAVAGCADQTKNGNETDVDCGGGACLACGGGKMCVQNIDCASNSCNFGMCGAPDSCSDGLLTGTEADIDCGGSCPNKCGDSKTCQSTTDCTEGLLCIESTCQKERDSDGDGVKDDLDRCPNTPQDEVADSEGCSPSQKFTCGDEISDGWRMRYLGSVLCDGNGAPDADPDDDGLVNVHEYNQNTDPMQADTDFDGWNDKIEVDAGTDPLDPVSHPPSKLRIFLWVLLILLILAALGFGGYIGYQYYLESRAAPQPVAPASVPVRPPARKQRIWPPVLERLRGIARREEPELLDRDWVSLGELAERLKKEKVPVRDAVFDKLTNLLTGKIPKKEAPRVLAAIRKEPEAFALLRRISFEQLTPVERALVRKRFALLKAGKLTSAEIEELLSKLRLTAAYYRTHKDELEQELAEFLGEKKRKR